MATPNEIPAPTKPQMAGCQQEPCSPSSDVPETLQAWRDYIESGLEEKLRDAAARMERERNEARKIAAELRDLVPWNEAEPWNFSWENVNVLAPAGEKTPTKQENE